MSARSSACSPLQSTERCFLLFWPYWLRRALWEWDTSSSDLFLNIWFNYIYNSDCAEGTRGLPPSSFIMKQNSSPDSRAYEKFPEADGRQTLLCVFPITLNHHSTSFFFFFNLKFPYTMLHGLMNRSFILSLMCEQHEEYVGKCLMWTLCERKFIRRKGSLAVLGS